jgi:hypothetical protein
MLEILSIVSDMRLHGLHNSGGYKGHLLNHSKMLITLVEAVEVALSAAKSLPASRRQEVVSKEMEQILNTNDYLDALDKEIEENSKWIKIPQGETKRFKFILREKPEYKEDRYRGQPTGVMKTFWTAIDVNSSNQKERIFKTADKSTRLIKEALRMSKDGVLDTTHEGTGSNTIYRPRVVNPKSESEIIGQNNNSENNQYAY